MKKLFSSNDPNNAEEFQRLSTTYYQPGYAQTSDISEVRDQIQKKRLSFKKIFVSLLLMLLIAPLVIGGWTLYNFSRTSQTLFGTNNVLPVLTPRPLKSAAGGRVNVLVVGYSADNQGHAGATLTDSIMVMSLAKNAPDNSYMLGIPRDLYVMIPDNGTAKINEAYQDGEAMKFSEAGYSPGGIGLLEKIITDNFDIELHYYTLINYAAVRDVVDALGGITVNIQSPDPRGLYDPNFKPEEGGPLRLENGQQTIDGQTALRLVRARGATAGSYGFPRSDLNRMQNQQAALAAMIQKLSWQQVLNPYTNGRIFKAFGDNTVTDIGLSEIIPLYLLFDRNGSVNMRSVSLHDINGENYLSGYRTPFGQAALIPAAGLHDYTDIRAVIDSLNTATQLD